MLATSLGDVFDMSDYPRCFFTRKYRGHKFVTYNLQYDAGALLQHLSKEGLKALQKEDTWTEDGYIYKVIANKFLSIRKGKNTIHLYDMLNFYKMSLDKASSKYLNENKLDIDVNKFTEAYVRKHYAKIAEYCIDDATKVKRLADILIKRFESYGVYPRKLFSVAYISWQYFRQKCPYVHVKRYWDNDRDVLRYAMKSYNGGKFEVTEKGTGYFYEYDIVSAYPSEISNLINIKESCVIWDSKYHKDSAYSFLLCKIDIPFEIFSPIAVKQTNVNYYPVGQFQKVITKTEYEYLTKQGCDVKILHACHLMVDKIERPYKKEVLKLMKLKDKYKRDKNDLDYHTMKIILNSFYGKFVQVIPDGKKYRAGSAWNPIYGAVITGNCRTRISELQQQHDSIIAVHTDSIISNKKLDIPKQGKLGDLIYECEGDGLILGSGVYQIGKKTRFRGFPSKTPLINLIPKRGKHLKQILHKPHTWREVAHRGMDIELINRFTDIERKLNVSFDTKRIWLGDYKDFKEVMKRNVESVPHVMQGEKF